MIGFAHGDSWRSVGIAALVAGAACQNAVPERFNTFPSSGVADLATFCAQRAELQCQQAEGCDPPAFAAWSQSGGCASLLSRRCLQDLAAEVAGSQTGRVRFSGSLAQSCLDATAALQCERAVPAVCMEVFTGTVQQGFLCAHDAECSRGLWCRVHAGAGCGECVSRGLLGSACARDVDCQKTLRCVDGSCAQAVAAGGTCSSSTACADGLVCGDRQGNPVCVWPSGAGGDCMITQCRDGLECVVTSGSATCRAPAEAGQACDPASVEQPDCQGSGRTLMCVGQTCLGVRVVGPGASCADTSVCDASAVCEAGTCVGRPQSGESCVATSAHGCFDSVCSVPELRCRAVSMAGENCVDSCVGALQCVEGVCGLPRCSGRAPRPLSDAGELP